MSDDSKLKDGGWKPPEPIFRSTEGRTPRTAKSYVDPDDIDTAAPDFVEADTDELDTEPATFAVPAADDGRVEPKPEPRPTPATAPPNSAGCFGSLFTMVGVAALLFAVLIAVALYYLLFYTPPSTTF